MVMAEQSNRDAVNQTHSGGQQSSDPVSTDVAATTLATTGEPTAQGERQSEPTKPDNVQPGDIKKGQADSPTVSESNSSAPTADTAKSDSSSTVGTPFHCRICRCSQC